MRIALMADIHANREAFEACLSHARRRGDERHVFLGDHIGYNADPAWTLATIMDLVGKGAMALRGNHDRGIAEPSERMNPDAAVAIARCGRAQQARHAADRTQALGGAAEAILDHVRANRVDHVILGARADSTMRSLLGSVSAEIAENAPCSVTAVRPRHRST